MLTTLHLLASLFFFAPSPVNVTVNSTAAQKGNFHLAVYATPKDYKARKSIVGGIKPAADGVSFLVNLPVGGNYVISGYHDVNGNGKLDFNMVGIPKEPYGFVTVPPSKWEEPDFSQIATTIKGGESTQLRLKLWKEH
jgi:uncharacterized protein (DUF2141 family)